jgi:hypothetical protein
MAQTHVARAALATFQMNDPPRQFLMSTLTLQVLLKRDRSHARIRPEQTVDRPRHGPHGGDAGHGSDANRLHPILQRSPIGFAQQEPATRSIPLELPQPSVDLSAAPAGAALVCLGRGEGPVLLGVRRFGRLPLADASLREEPVPLRSPRPSPTHQHLPDLRAR